MLCTTEKQCAMMEPGYGMTAIIDPAGHYSNQSLRLVVDETPHTPVTHVGTPASAAVTFDELQDVAV